MTKPSTERLEKRLERSISKAKDDSGTAEQKRAKRKLVKRLQRKISRTNSAYKNAERSRKSKPSDAE